MELANNTFIITGGGSGLGGATLVLCDINEEAGNQTASSIGGAARFVKCDVVDEDQVQAVVDAAVESFGTIRMQPK